MRCVSDRPNVKVTLRTSERTAPDVKVVRTIDETLVLVAKLFELVFLLGQGKASGTNRLVLLRHNLVDAATGNGSKARHDDVDNDSDE
jgi:hypothetical protein